MRQISVLIYSPITQEILEEMPPLRERNPISTRICGGGRKAGPAAGDVRAPDASVGLLMRSTSHRGSLRLMD